MTLVAVHALSPQTSRVVLRPHLAFDHAGSRSRLGECLAAAAAAARRQRGAQALRRNDSWVERAHHCAQLGRCRSVGRRGTLC
eukprot:scaffold13786_cov58-Phaeocystis_antarctica.AAC.3